MDEPISDGAADTSGDDRSDGGHRMPGWVRGFVIAGAVVAVLVVVMLVLGGGRHGPGRHLEGSATAHVETLVGDTLPADPAGG